MNFIRFMSGPALRQFALPYAADIAWLEGERYKAAQPHGFARAIAAPKRTRVRHCTLEQTDSLEQIEPLRIRDEPGDQSSCWQPVIGSHCFHISSPRRTTNRT